jgi:pimeloyl-ACP methyl ester carboxylesterase
VSVNVTEFPDTEPARTKVMPLMTALPVRTPPVSTIQSVPVPPTPSGEPSAQLPVRLHVDDTNVLGPRRPGPPLLDLGGVGQGTTHPSGGGTFSGVMRVEQREVQLHGHRVRYRICGEDPSGKRPVLLLVHGMAGSSTTWQYVMPALAERYTVIAPDLPGHGQSDKPRQDYSLGAHANALRDLLIAIGIEQATVVGQSLGGGIAMQLAYQHPCHCERLVLVSSGGLGQEVSWILRFLAFPGVEYLAPVIFPSFVRDAGNSISGRLRRLGLRAPRVEEEWRSYVSLTDPDTRGAFLRTLRAVVDVTGQTVSARDRLYLSSRLPTLIIWGERDRIIPVSHANEAHQAMPGSRLELFEESGHFPHVEEPDRFVDVLTGFIDSTEPVHLDGADWRDLLMGGPPA